MSETLNGSNKNPLDELSSKAKSRPVCNVKEMQAKINKLERELEQFPDHRWMEKYYDKVEELNRAERANEVLKEACEKYANEDNWAYGEFYDYHYLADKALSKIRSEG